METHTLTSNSVVALKDLIGAGVRNEEISHVLLQAETHDLRWGIYPTGNVFSLSVGNGFILLDGDSIEIYGKDNIENLYIIPDVSGEYAKITYTAGQFIGDL